MKPVPKMLSHDLMSFAPTSELMGELPPEWFYDDDYDDDRQRSNIDDTRERIASAILDSVVTFIRECSEEIAREVLGDCNKVVSLIGPRLATDLELSAQWGNAIAEVLAERLTPSLQEKILALREIPQLAARTDNPEPLLDLTDITLKKLAEDF